MLTAAGVFCVLGTLTIPLHKSRGEKTGMIRIYLRILTVPAFLRPKIAAGSG
ncbi:hypothetical protein LCL61_31345 [Amycolatopsis coloradensis]|uniref:Uncharacterized protein n=1 Tax=Amycolatopsis coloradensis TaxID=76021 RepID=A0ACD5BKY5_9PSEU